VHSPDNHALADTKYYNHKMIFFLYFINQHSHVVQGTGFHHSTSICPLAFLVNILLIAIQILCHANIPAMSATLVMVDLLSHGKNKILFYVSAFG
jgi:hypothetical protein